MTSKILATRHAGANAAGQLHQVVTVSNSIAANKGFRKKPCMNCPWRCDSTGEFPAEAFRHSANTAYDMATNLFACHTAGLNKPQVCAGFMLRGSEHNLSVRLARIQGRVPAGISNGGHALHENYRAMAIANGVDPDDDAIAPCR